MGDGDGVGTQPCPPFRVDDVDLGSADDWEVKGEGMANLVLALAADGDGGAAAAVPAHLAGRVLRVRKHRRRGAVDADPAVAALERELWGDVAAAAAAAGVPLDAAAAAAALRPLLPAALLPPAALVRLPPGFAAAAARRTGANVDERVAVGALMPDATRFAAPADAAALPAGWAPAAGAPAACVELKPKWGAAPRCATVHPARRAAKWGAPRFRLLQALKLEQGRLCGRTAPSEYDPLDLFSGDAGREAAALRAVLDRPQSNLRAFIGGRAVAPAGAGAATAAALLPPARGGAGAQREGLVRLLLAVLRREAVLPALLAAQQACEVDVEGVHHVLLRLLGRDADVGAAGGGTEARGGEPATEGAHAEHAAALAALAALGRGAALRLLRAYALAATARDASVMVALQRLEPRRRRENGAAAPAEEGWEGLRALERRQGADGAPGVVALRGGGADDPGGGCALLFRYRITLVDLDVKPLGKVPVHAATDAAAAAAAARARAAAEGRGLSTD